MRKIRNPRYAPESLERKLFPTDLIGGLTAVVVASTPPIDPPPPPPPPELLPAIPLGPSGPAITLTVCV